MLRTAAKNRRLRKIFYNYLFAPVGDAARFLYWTNSFFPPFSRFVNVFRAAAQHAQRTAAKIRRLCKICSRLVGMLRTLHQANFGRTRLSCPKIVGEAQTRRCWTVDAVNDGGEWIYMTEREMNEGRGEWMKEVMNEWRRRWITHEWLILYEWPYELTDEWPSEWPRE